MNDEDVLQHYRDAGALLEGHFILTSGLRSPTYLQCAKVLMYPDRAGALCSELASRITASLGEGAIDLVVSPAMGGVVVGYEMGRQLRCPAIFAERVDGEFVLRRGFEIPPGARVLMAEDIVTTGLSSRECIACIQDLGGEVVAASCLVDRSDGKVDVGVPLFALVGMEVPAYEADNLPPELAAIPAVKPGSRGLK
ncbi:MAG: orotate phosphoribosyltransferase [Rhodospirillaceae bacterium]|jgi:orotate phosphoribosyltransferase|nr:orotate phosphoribosyltransferase [Rhodospirillaceae bacterium]MBT4043148.1 orotate phosphoribosyltransferase [Rhodospirillaceae bacterium]MBT4690163.1 orotate phosphoribosyltransferase [Rhodospirillaceae bacterium]MBT5080728.1 orotate phosphoribosyltransferase [Rhodospirillaceae bacterium]MBT5525150.1 orotate phosphoribosyltransferase [Rhodospirillaceae bacterium]